MWRLFWRVIGVGAFVMSALSCFFLYALWKATDLKPIARGQPVSNSLDVISLQIDILSITMAAVGLALAVVGLIGYQTIKDASVERAEKAANEMAEAKAIEIADSVATKAIALHMENIERTIRGLQSGGDGPIPVEPADVLELTEEEKGV